MVEVSKHNCLFGKCNYCGECKTHEIIGFSVMEYCPNYCEKMDIYPIKIPDGVKITYQYYYW